MRPTPNALPPRHSTLSCWRSGRASQSSALPANADRESVRTRVPAGLPNGRTARFHQSVRGRARDYATPALAPFVAAAGLLRRLPTTRGGNVFAKRRRRRARPSRGGGVLRTLGFRRRRKASCPMLIGKAARVISRGRASPDAPKQLANARFIEVVWLCAVG